MSPKRAPQSSNSLSITTELSSSSNSSPGLFHFPRATSPSGISHLLAKPSKWFRGPSGSKNLPNSAEPRSSTSSMSSRRPKISHPTDPRPIMSTLHSDSYVGSGSGSRSVLDLSMGRPSITMDTLPSLPSTPTSPARSLTPSRGLGDLRNISRRTWSKSADDLIKLSIRSPIAPPSVSPLDTNLHEKIQVYRTKPSDRSKSVTTSSVSTTNSSYRNVDFPIITTSGLSSSPPQGCGVLPSSGSVPTSLRPSQDSNSHTHVRSHSFTPRIASRLMPPKQGSLPPSPMRMYSGSSEMDPNLPVGAVRGPFPFGIGNNKSSSPSATPTTSNPPKSLSAPPSPPMPLMEPPTIIEPSQEEHDGDEKRTSQIIYHSGFVNRLSQFSPALMQQYAHQHGTGALTKGWKPFKLVLKGSKLYFYKPPNDRVAAIKELFPTELVTTLEEGGADLEGMSRDEDDRFVSKGKEREEGRRKRAFWGRRTHPDLVRGGNGEVESGTLEALVHESAFGTTFLSEDGDTHVPVQNQEWRSFSLATVLCLPQSAGKARFEAEFLRCCNYLVSGAEDNKKMHERARVQLLAEEYLRYHDKPADPDAWEDWRKDTIPDFPTLEEFSSGSSSGVPRSSSTQALYAPSPALGGDMSSNLATFSPRPGQTTGQMVSVLGALDSSTSPAMQAPALSTNPSTKQAILNAMEQHGLTRDVFLRLDSYLVANSLNIFHRSVWQQASENMTLDAVMIAESGDHNPFLTFFGSELHLHWLTKAILLQLLGPGSLIGGPDQLASSGDERVYSKGHSRSEIISGWVRIGELSRQSGDECSWKAICSALFSRPIARLEKSWKRVDSAALAIAENWTHPGPDGTPALFTEARQTPWGGEVRDNLKEKIEEARIVDGATWNVKPFLEVKEMWEHVRTSFSLCPRAMDFSEVDESEDMMRMLNLWRMLRTNDGSMGGGAVSKFTRIDQFMSLSLAAEPRRRGLYEPYFWSSPQQHSVHPLLPLQFPEPMPSISLLDRAEIVRGRMESSNLNLQDVHVARNMLLNPGNHIKRSNLEPPSREAATVTGDSGGIEIPVFNGELLVLVQSGGDSSGASQPSSRAPSRPPSSVLEGTSMEKAFTRAPSIRVRPNRPGSKSGLERKASMARRNSLPSMTKPSGEMLSSEAPSERPLRVRIRAGTLDRLVDILAHGLQGVSVAFSDDNGEMPLREGKHRDLRVDHVDFSNVWWSTFRSFVTPLVLFELLRKRYQQAQVKSPTASVGGLLHAARIKHEILDALHEWFQKGSCAEDALDDPRLYDGLKSFLLHSPSDHEAPVSYSDFRDLQVQEVWNSVDRTRKLVAAVFSAETSRPTNKPNLVLELLDSPVGSDDHHYSTDPPDIDSIGAKDLVENMDAMIAAAFQHVTHEDLLVTADLLEIQSADRIGWFVLRDPSSVSEEVELQTLHTLISEVEPTTMISELSQDSLYRLLPGSVRACIRAFGVLRKWVVSKIVSPNLGLRIRQRRIELLLQTIEISRIRNMDPSSSGSITESPCIRSFVEAVVTSALLGAESRLHYRAWQNVANARATSFEALTTLLSAPVSRCTQGEPLTVDIGWLLERMLEVINMPDIIDPSPEEPQPRVNFDKRRYICRLATNVSSLTPARKDYRRKPTNAQDLERLNNVEQEVSHVQLDFRSIREEALREALPGGAPGKKASRPFNSLVIAQQEKNKRDKYARDRVSKEKRQEQHRHEKREEYFNKVMNQRKPQLGAQKQYRNKKSMSSAFFQFMRPISSAFSSDTSLYTAGMKRTPAELDFTPASKPALTLSVAEARIAQFINNERSFTFQLDTEDGGHYLLQALDRKDMMKWINKINHVGKIAAKRRLTYLGNHSNKPQLADDLSAKPKTGSRDPHAVFGVDLQFLVSREHRGDPPPGALPLLVEQCIDEIEARGLSEVGIYRIAGATSEINSLKEAFNRGESLISRSTDIYALCDVIKSYFRTLPDPVIPASMYSDFIASAKIQDLEPRLNKIRGLVHALPSVNFDLLKRFIEHLDKVTDYEESNQMTASSLAIVISPNILRAPNNDFSVTMSNIGHAHGVAKALITHCHVVFGENDQEADNDEEEDDFEPPILEEEEEDEDPLPASSVAASPERSQTTPSPLNELTP